MPNTKLVLYGHPTPSDINFMISENENVSFSSSISSTRSDAQSAPPECEQIFNQICEEYAAIESGAMDSAVAHNLKQCQLPVAVAIG